MPWPLMEPQEVGYSLQTMVEFFETSPFLKTVLALASRGEKNNFLHLFDITRFNKNHVQEICLEPFLGKVPVREVSCMAFSPDGIYLSLGRTDNSLHVYDSRMLGKGVLQKYRHKEPRCVSPGSTLFGVTHAQWVVKHSGQYALLSGGEDGELFQNISCFFFECHPLTTLAPFA